MRHVRLLSAAVVLTALLGSGTAYAQESPGAAPPADYDPAAHGLKLTPLDLSGGVQVNSLGPVGLPGASTCRRYYLFSYKAGRYVSEEQGYTGSSHNMLRARTAAGSLGTWEQFSLCAYNSRTDLVFIQGTSGYLATAEYGYAGNSKGMLRSRGEWPGDWEVFEVWSDAGRYFLRNQATTGWVSVRADLTGSNLNMLRGNGTSAGPWEQLSITPVA